MREQLNHLSDMEIEMKAKMLALALLLCMSADVENAQTNEEVKQALDLCGNQVPRQKQFVLLRFPDLTV